MSQMGMKMPGGRRGRAAGPDVYTGLLFLAVLALGGACTLMYFAAVKLSPDGNPITLQEDNRVRLQSPS